MSVQRENDPRAAMERLPRYLQRFLTELTGKAGPHQEETFRHTTASRLSMTLAQFAAGVGGGTLLVHAGGAAWLLVPGALILTAGAARAMQTTYLHQGSHGHLSADRRRNDFLAELASVLGWLAPLEVYRKEHRRHHRMLATRFDSDLERVVKLMGFKTGRTRAESWRHLRRLLVSPTFHLTTIFTRLWTNLVLARGWRRFASWAQGLGLLAFVAATGLWLEFLVAYVVPMTIMFAIAAVLQTLSEHTWVRTGEGRDPQRVVWSRLTRNRYFGEMPPDDAAGRAAWARWWLRMLLIHGVLRIWVVPLDLAAHHWHHTRPGDPNWPRVAFAYRDGRGPGSAEDGLALEVWGLAAALNLTFDHLAIVPDNVDLIRPGGYGFIDPDLLTM